MIILKFIVLASLTSCVMDGNLLHFRFKAKVEINPHKISPESFGIIHANTKSILRGEQKLSHSSINFQMDYVKLSMPFPS